MSFQNIINYRRRFLTIIYFTRIYREAEKTNPFPQNHRKCRLYRITSLENSRLKVRTLRHYRPFKNVEFFFLQ